MQLQYLGYIFHVEEEKLSQEITVPKDHIVKEETVKKKKAFHPLSSGNDSLLLNTR